MTIILGAELFVLLYFIIQSEAISVNVYSNLICFLNVYTSYVNLVLNLCLLLFHVLYSSCSFPRRAWAPELTECQDGWVPMGQDGLLWLAYMLILSIDCMTWPGRRDQDVERAERADQEPQDGHRQS